MPDTILNVVNKVEVCRLEHNRLEEGLDANIINFLGPMKLVRPVNEGHLKELVCPIVDTEHRGDSMDHLQVHMLL